MSSTLRLRTWSVCVALAVILAVPVRTALASTAFTYQGQLAQPDGRTTVESADVRFTLFDAVSGGTQVGPAIEQSFSGMLKGRFITTLDFGVSVDNTTPRWLEISVRVPAGAGTFKTLVPRQPVMLPQR